MKMRLADRILGGVLCILGMLSFRESYSVWTGWDGAGLMPLIIGVILVILSIFFQLSPAAKGVPIQSSNNEEGVRIGVISGSFAIYLISMNWLGYMLATWLFLAGVSIYISPRRRLTPLIWTGAVSLATYVIFTRYLSLTLPQGFIKF
jgi:putative tricarboxylic transport membrane protein